MDTEHRARRAPAMLVVGLLITMIAGCATPPVVTTEQSPPSAQPSTSATPVPPTPTTEVRAHVPAIKLNGPLPEGAQVAQFTVSPDGRHVVYIISRSSAPATPTPATSLPPVPSVSPPPFSNTPQVTSQMYSVPVEGGTPVEMTASIDPPIERVAQFAFSPDNQHVAFLLDAHPSPLYVASLDGRTLETTDDEYGSGVYDFAWSPDGKHLTFSVFGTFDDQQGSYSLPASGGTPTKLSDIGFVSDMSAITSDSQYLVFAGAAPNASKDDRRGFSSLYRVPVRGGAVVELVSNFMPPNTVIHIDAAGPLPFQVSPDGTTVVYASLDSNTGHFALFKAAVTGGPPQQLTQPQTVADSVFSFHISPDSKHVVFRTGAQYVNQSPHGMTGGDVVGLQSVPLAGGAVATLSPPLPDVAEIAYVQISADSRWAVYSTEQPSGGTSELRSVPITGGTPVKLADPQAVAGRELIFFSISANSQYVVYDTVQPEPGAPLLGVYSVPIDGGPSTKLGPITSAGISPDSTFVLFYDYMHTDMYSIFQTPRDGGVAVKLNGALGPDKHVYQHVISLDSQHIVYTAAPSYGGTAELYSVPAAR